MDKSLVSSIILAGGKGKRFGRDKLSEKIGDLTLMERALDRVRPVSDEILVVIAQGQAEPQPSPAAAQVIFDLYPGKSALGGIYTGLVASHSSHSLVVAADMPFLNTELLSYMIESAASYDVVIPRVDSALEPLHAVYSKKCVDPMRRQIERGELRIRAFFAEVSVRYVEKEEIATFDTDHLSFFNVNTEADLRWARELWQSGSRQV
jgi:molybdopterin-guanine dinucleotide biosynthesis protein A